MTVHDARIALAAVLIGISALGPSTRLHGQQAPAELAIDDLRERAELGDAEAQYNLGFRYSIGSGVPRNQAEAVRWYRLAAEQGHADAQVNLGYMPETGEGVPQDAAEAVRWFRLAADQGLAVAKARRERPGQAVQKMNKTIIISKLTGSAQEPLDAAAPDGNTRRQLTVCCGLI